MLHLARRVIGSTVRAPDGDIGVLQDFYYSEDDWVIRYLLVEAGGWLDDRHVVIPAEAVQGAWGRDGILVGLSQQTVARGPFRTALSGAAVVAPEGIDLVGDLSVRTMLRSIRGGAGSHLHAVDGDIGHVDDFLIEESDWRMPYLLVDTSNRIGGRAVIVRTDLVRRLDTGAKSLSLTVTREQVRNGPTFDTIAGLVNVAETSAPFTFM